MNSSRVGTIELILAMVLSGTIGIFVIESGQSAMNVVFFRCLFGALSLLAFCSFKGLLKKKYFSRRKVSLILFGGAAIVFNWFFLFESFSLTSITVATVTYHTQPFFVLIMGSFLLKEKIGKDKVLWVILAFVGLMLVSKILSGGHEQQSSFAVGILFSLLAAFLYAIATLVAKNLKSVPPHLIALLQTSLGAVLLLPMASLSEVPVIGTHWYWLIGLGTIHTCVMYILLYSSFQKLSLPMIAVLTFIYPVVAIFADYLVYDETITVTQAVGVMLIFVSSISVTLNKSFPVLNLIKSFKAAKVGG